MSLRQKKGGAMKKMNPRYTLASLVALMVTTTTFAAPTFEIKTDDRDSYSGTNEWNNDWFDNKEFGWDSDWFDNQQLNPLKDHSRSNQKSDYTNWNNQKSGFKPGSFWNEDFHDVLDHKSKNYDHSHPTSKKDHGGYGSNPDYCPPMVPAPSAIALSSIGLLFIRVLRSRQVIV